MLTFQVVYGEERPLHEIANPFPWAAGNAYAIIIITVYRKYAFSADFPDFPQALVPDSRLSVNAQKNILNGYIASFL